MVLVVSHPGPVLDEIPYPTRGPQSAGISQRLGPALERALEVGKWPGSNFAGRPLRPALRRPRTPDCSSSRAQRLTDCRCTPNSRATSDWLIPVAVIAPPPSAAVPTQRNPAAHPLDYPCITY